MRAARPNAVLVEGKDDKHVVIHLAMHGGLPDTIDVQEFEGVEDLLTALPVLLRAANRERVGVVLDADQDLGRRWQAVRDRIRQAGYPDVPEQPAPGGMVIPAPDPFHPRVGVWLMPDNSLPGMLEHFLKTLVPDGDALLPYACECVAGIPDGDRRFTEEHRGKAEIHTWLAWQDLPGLPFGTAITRRLLSPDQPQGRQFVAWMRTLFEVD